LNRIFKSTIDAILFDVVVVITIIGNNCVVAVAAVAAFAVVVVVAAILIIVIIISLIWIPRIPMIAIATVRSNGSSMFIIVGCWLMQE
jgi:hypothetical protein